MMVNWLKRKKGQNSMMGSVGCVVRNLFVRLAIYLESNFPEYSFSHTFFWPDSGLFSFFLSFSEDLIFHSFLCHNHIHTLFECGKSLNWKKKEKLASNV